MTSKIYKPAKILLALICLCLITSSAFALDLDGLDILENKERVRLGIMRFYSKTYGVPDGMAAGISDFFARILFKADDIMLVERERLDDVASELRLGMSGLVDDKTAAQIGKLAGCEYMLMGAITNLAHGASGGYLPGIGVPFLGGVGVSTQKVKADLDVRVVKVETGEIVFADSASGEAAKSDSSVSLYGVSVSNSEFGGLEGTAILKATAKLAPSIQKALTGRDTLTEKLKAEEKKNKKAAKSSSKDSKEGKSKTKKTSRKTSKKKADTTDEE